MYAHCLAHSTIWDLVGEMMRMMTMRMVVAKMIKRKTLGDMSRYDQEKVYQEKILCLAEERRKLAV